MKPFKRAAKSSVKPIKRAVKSVKRQFKPDRLAPSTASQAEQDDGGDSISSQSSEETAPSVRLAPTREKTRREKSASDSSEQDESSQKEPRAPSLDDPPEVRLAYALRPARGVHGIIAQQGMLYGVAQQIQGGGLPAPIANAGLVKGLGELLQSYADGDASMVVLFLPLVDWVLSDPQLAGSERGRFQTLRARATATQAHVVAPRAFGDVDARADAGSRWKGVREDLVSLRDMKLDAALPEYQRLGGKVLAAILEPPQPRNTSAPGISNESDGRILVDKETNLVIGDLLDAGEAVKVPRDLLRQLDALHDAVLADLCAAFVDEFGGLAGIQAWIALRRAGVSETRLARLLERATMDVAKGRTVSRLAISGEVRGAKFIDYTPMLARALTFGHGSATLFPASASPTLVPLASRPVSKEAIAEFDTLDELIGVPSALDLGKFRANGRTLTYTRPDGSVVAIKCMKQGESPAKLQREYDSFTLMAKESEGYPAKARDFEAHGKKFPIARLRRDKVPQEVLTLFEQELSRGGIELEKTDGMITCMSYEVSGIEDSGGYFRYLEETEDGDRFVAGFERAMATLGQMAGKGYFNPNLIKNSYHDPKGGRAWVWSPTMLVPSHDNAGREDQPLANAKWSNFREAGLADPDEFRHISQLDVSELGEVMGDKFLAQDMVLGSSDEERIRLVAAYLIGRMVHEATVIATRRMVLQGAFDEGAGRKKQGELTSAFGQSLKRGIAAFAEGFAGVDGGALTDALAENGLDLDKGIAGMLAEREALYSFDYIRHWRDQDAGYFGDLFGIDPKVITFAPKEEVFGKAPPPTPLQEIEQSSDPVEALIETQARGFLTVVGQSEDGVIFLGDLGWIDWSILDASPLAVKRRDTDRAGLVAEVRVSDQKEFDQYMAKLKAQAHEHQHAGPINGGYFFLNEQRVNLLLSSTLVNLRAQASS